MKNFRSRLLPGVLLAIAAFAPESAFAGAGANNLSVSATVSSSCSITSTTALAFGTATASSLPLDGQGAISFTCTNTTPWMVYGDVGQNASGSQRRMINSGQYLAYNIYADSGRTAVFPVALSSLGAGNTGGTGTGLSQTVTVYGRIPAGTALPAPGTYTDTIVLTLNW
ncbi:MULTISPECIES: spore coat U domain-containing protein [unclassified Novosphingobium]|uniref:Csu type fimbrial protein n=1 Tax=unclassified Novosphingobium TaxID=2644732 RepID=UPI00146BBE55|nr:MULTISPECIES: spore coat U domain-containing protein [unclassified Novosphingobium]NMN03847.1 spore coat protein U-like protein [Novosphingobium sp. SG919]NMN86163.1 spore coat protein U-like protein [Novosphingobium sp. SG916]